MDLTVRIVRSISEVDRGAWDALDHGPSPFLRWGFLDAAERSGSVGGRSGWEPHYLLVEIRQPGGAKPARLVGAVAAFRKDHSYGEYIFDWAWARAAKQSRVPYYPKLVIAAPVTPATGPRLLLDPDPEIDRMEVTDALCHAVRALADELACHSVHWLFCTRDEQAALQERGFMPRASFQFHWRNDGYRDFDAFLAGLTSRKRKQIRKERRRAQSAVDDVTFVPGSELEEADLDAMDRYYRSTVRAHGGMDYLRPGFFHALRERMPQSLLFARVRAGGETIAGAMYLETEQALYGRYWGCDRHVDCLHFETAYYAGIERCIERGLGLFEAGAQGEHKLLRGFMPSATHSAHWVRHPGLAEGIQRFLRQESAELGAYMGHLAELSPFRQSG